MSSVFRLLSGGMIWAFLILSVGCPTLLNAQEESGLVFKTRLELGIGDIGTTVIGRLDNQPIFVTQGKLCSEDGELGLPTLQAIRLDGEVLWTHVGKPGTSVNGVYIQWLDADDLEQPLISWAYGPPANGGEMFGSQGGLFRARDGSQVQRFEKSSNNPSLVLDLDNDGNTEFIRCTQQSVSRLNLVSREVDWQHTEGILFCWSYPTASDVTNDGLPEIIWGSEYDMSDGKRSTFMAIDGNGKEVWRLDGIDEDLGSTPVFVADVDGDGRDELVKNGLDLVGKNQLESNHLYIVSQKGKLVRKIRSHIYSTGIGDLNADGQLEAFGVISKRDGGTLAKEMSHLRCVNLHTGKTTWEVEVPRVGLPAANALAADVDGDGYLEALMADGNPTYYGHLPGPNWGAVYVVSGEGKLQQTIDLPYWATRLSMCDVDNDGLNELIVQVESVPASLYVYDTKAPATRKDWPMAFGSIENWSAEHRVENKN